MSISLLQAPITFVRRMGCGRFWCGCPSWQPGSKVWSNLSESTGQSLDATTSAGNKVVSSESQRTFITLIEAALPHLSSDVSFTFSFATFVCVCSLVVRFDYEGLDPRAAFYLMRDLETVISDKAFTSQKFAVGERIYSVERAENFEYIDPVDGTVARNQVSVGNSGSAGCHEKIRERMLLLTLLFHKKLDWRPSLPTTGILYMIWSVFFDCLNPFIILKGTWSITPVEYSVENH